MKKILILKKILYCVALAASISIVNVEAKCVCFDDVFYGHSDIIKMIQLKPIDTIRDMHRLLTCDL